jgi:hypothetical protein
MGILLVINNFTANSGIPRSYRSANACDELKPASISSSCKTCSALGCADFVHPQSLTDCLYVPPPPHISCGKKLTKKRQFSVFSPQKTPGAFV